MVTAGEEGVRLILVAVEEVEEALITLLMAERSILSKVEGVEELATAFRSEAWEVILGEKSSHPFQNIGFPKGPRPTVKRRRTHRPSHNKMRIGRTNN